MAIIDLGGFGLVIPPWGTVGDGSFPYDGGNVFAIDASGEKFAFIVQAPKTGSIRKIGFATGALTSAQDLKVSLQNVAAGTGDPDETIDQSVVFASGSLVANDFLVTDALSADRSVTAGELLAVVFEFNATIGNLQFSANSAERNAFSYVSHKTGGTWVKAQVAPMMLFGYSDDSFAAPPNCYPWKAFSSFGLHVDAATDEYGVKFRVPRQMRLAGVSWFGQKVSGDPDYRVKVYDSVDTVLVNDLIEHTAAAYNNGQDRFWHLALSTKPTIDANEYHRVTLLPTTTDSLGVAQGQFASGHIGVFPLGADFIRTVRSDGGSWIDSSTHRPMIFLRFDGL